MNQPYQEQIVEIEISIRIIPDKIDDKKSSNFFVKPKKKERK